MHNGGCGRAGRRGAELGSHPAGMARAGSRPGSAGPESISAPILSGRGGAAKSCRVGVGVPSGPSRVRRPESARRGCAMGTCFSTAKATGCSVVRRRMPSTNPVASSRCHLNGGWTTTTPAPSRCAASPERRSSHGPEPRVVCVSSRVGACTGCGWTSVRWVGTCGECQSRGTVAERGTPKLRGSRRDPRGRRGLHRPDPHRHGHPTKDRDGGTGPGAR